MKPLPEPTGVYAPQEVLLEQLGFEKWRMTCLRCYTRWSERHEEWLHLRSINSYETHVRKSHPEVGAVQLAVDRRYMEKMINESS